MAHDEMGSPTLRDPAALDEPSNFADFSDWLQTRGDRRTRRRRPRGATAWLVKASALWALIELPVEFWASQGVTERAALLFSSAVWVSLAWLVLRGNGVARGVFIFLCALGVLAVAPALPAEYSTFPLAFYLSLTECVLKALLFVAFVSRYIAMES
ncbi:hypothetical protein [Paraburkholderia acidisoli]|uniref:Uncharacterized protein n=1 Tax=Paraburkholderia acidisoli TaxID=2571748 RepID=A0A7Z2JH39_9BURK|nr:hypothetical protein [Paraburkholderia acidisoli]QGZ65302.1 hypothetical protein FAZ98_26400 [Paraburkholderia acidisoli]